MTVGEARQFLGALELSYDFLGAVKLANRLQTTFPDLRWGVDVYDMNHADVTVRGLHGSEKPYGINLQEVES